MDKGTPTPCHGTILAVDDEPTSLKMLTAVLTAEGYQVHSATGGEHALELVAKTLPDLILLDIAMPGIDGLEVCRRLKAHEKTGHIPLIFLSATTETEERVQGFKLGAVDFVAKPFQRQELLARVQTHLALTRLQHDLKRQAAELREANMLLQSEVQVREMIASSLAESEEKFRTLAGSAQDAFLMLDDEDRIVFWNRAASGMFGYSEEEISGEKFHERLKPERFRAAFTKGFGQYLANETGSTNGKVVEMITLRKDGTEFPVELSAAVVKLREKLVTVVVIRDITGRRRAQETLLRSEERLNLALDAAHMGTWDFDLATGSVWRSRLHDQIFGFATPQEHWNHETFLACLAPEDRKRCEAEFLAGTKSGIINSEYRIIRDDDKTVHWIRVQGRVYYDKEQKPIRMMGIVVDITESKQVEAEQKSEDAQNSLSQKLESVGRLASGVAHEINTPMQFITDNTQFLKGAVASLTNVLAAYRTMLEAIASGKNTDEAAALARAAEEENELGYMLDEIPRTFSETMSGLQRVTQIIKSLKEFSHPNQSSKQLADLNKAINTTITISRHEWKYMADLVAELDPDLPMIPLRIDEMNQVVLNLIVNASHAIGDALKQRGESKGVITVRTKQDGDHALIEVQDNGTGIPKSAQSHIFEPFFTTKGVGKGTGQGLAIIRTIVVKNHGGTIWFTTEPGKGTTFHVRLPLAVPEEAQADESVLP